MKKVFLLTILVAAIAGAVWVNRAFMSPPPLTPTEPASAKPSDETPAPQAWPEKPPFEIVGGQGVAYLVVVSPEQATQRRALWQVADYLHAIRGGKTPVQVMFWTDKRQAPSSLPMTDAQTATQAAQVNINLATGLRELQMLNGNRAK